MMTLEMMETVADRLATTARMAEMYKDNYPENHRECPFVSELKGMELMLKAMGIPFEYTYDDEVKHITAVSVGTDKCGAAVIL